MLKRKLYGELKKWIESPYRDALFVKGARQVGKTYIIERFLSEHCNNYIKLDFVDRPELKELFSQGFDIDSFITNVSVQFPNSVIKPYSTVLFFDEIQMCPEAKSSLKYFVKDGRFRVIASGSLLGILYGSDLSNPVGYVRNVEMFSLDFEEFLWAIGINENTSNVLKTKIRDKEPYGNTVLKKLDEYYHIYMIVGGMPEAVCSYIDTKNINEVIGIQKKILEGYREDVAKYSKKSDRYKIYACFDSIPFQLSKESKKFSYSMIDSEAHPTFDTYESCFNWMRDASIINVCHNLHAPKGPLEEHVIGSQFKLYVHDTGLLTCMLGIDVAKSLLSGDTRVNHGAIAENAVAESLQKNGIKLRYFRKDSLEVDFIVTLGTNVTAIEVKSGNNKQAKSLKSIKDKYDVKRRMKFEKTDIYVDDEGVEHYPLFAGSFIKEMYTDPTLNIDTDTSLFDDEASLR